MNRNSQGTVRDYPVKEKIKKMLFKIELHRTALTDVKKHEGGNSPFPVLIPLKHR